jgi:hypothetical protein
VSWGVHFKGPTWATAITLLLASFAVDSRSVAAAPATPPASSTNAEVDLEVLADFFVPGDVIERLVTGGCTFAYRTKLDKEPEVEQSIPGIHDRMIAAAAQYCAANLPAWLNDAHARVKDHWRGQLAPKDLHRLAVFLAKPAAETNALKIEVRPGETVKSAVQRADSNGSAQKADLQRREGEFARTPGGARLLEMVTVYQREWEEEARSPAGPVKIMAGALQAAHAAANQYAKENGFDPVYP